MFDLGILGTLIGLITCYLVLSLVCSGIAELIAQKWQWRGKFLRTAILRLLCHSDALTKQVYDHPLVAALKSADRDPSYIPPPVFADVIIDITTSRNTDKNSYDGAPEARLPISIGEQLGRFARAENSDVAQEARQHISKTLRQFLNDCGGDFSLFKARIERWYQDAMDRIKGSYRRRVQPVLLLIGFVVAFALNADTIRIVRVLQENPAIRAAIGAVGERYTNEGIPDSATDGAHDASTANLEQMRQLVGEIEPLLGWSSDEFQALFTYCVLLKLLGLIFTSMAVSLGAPFWFSALQKMLHIKNSVEAARPETVKAEDSTGMLPVAENAGAATLAPDGTGKPDRYLGGLRGFKPFAATYEPVNAYWLARFSKLAYEDEETFKATCLGWGLSAELLSVCDNDKNVDTQVGVAANADIVIIAFRGTEPTKPADILTDIKVASKHWTPGGNAHTGFCQAFTAAWEPQLQESVRKYQDNRQAIWITGHSLGGALALLAGSQLQFDYLEKIKSLEKDLTKLETAIAEATRSTASTASAELIQQKLEKERELAAAKRGGVHGVYTFGQPRVGNKDFADTVKVSLRGTVFRHVNNRDIVPRVPPRRMDYRHAGSVRYFDEFGQLHVDPGLWYRLLDTVFVSPDELRDKATESIKDHNMGLYVDLVGRVAGIHSDQT